MKQDIIRVLLSKIRHYTSLITLKIRPKNIGIRIPTKIVFKIVSVQIKIWLNISFKIFKVHETINL